MAKRLTQEQALERCIEAHNGFYSYPNMVYTKTKEKIEIECPVHGSFWQSHNTHTMGGGCSKCSGQYQHTTEEWKELYTTKFGSKYNLDKVIYKDVKSKVIAICNIHGEFSTYPGDLIRGIGCSKCSGMYSPTTAEWVSNYKKKFGDRYCLDKVVYVRAHEKVIFGCSLHGNFSAKASDLINGSGCPKCGKLDMARRQSSSKEEFITKAEKVHGVGNFSYTDFCYIKSSIPSNIKCLKCNTAFLQSANSHLQGSGCPPCSYISNGHKARSTKEQFVQKALVVHGADKFSYSKVVYETNHTKVIITCNHCGEDFKQAPSNHTQGTGCPHCVSMGFNVSKPAILYYLQISKPGLPTVFKIGITNRSVKERFSNEELRSITILNEDHFLSGEECLKEEQRILKEFKAYKYTGPKIFTVGYTEMFALDIRNIY